MNEFNNNSTSSFPDGPEPNSNDDMIGCNVAIVCLSLLGALLSALSIITILYFPKLRKRTSNKLLVNLFAADFAVSLLMLVYHALMLDFLLVDERVRGMQQAKNFHIIMSAFMFLSIVNRISVTLDRALAVKKPFYYESKFNTGMAFRIIVAQNLSAVLYFVLLYFASGWMDKEGYYDLMSLSFIIVIVIGFLVLSISNLVVFFEARKQINMICKVTFTDDNKKQKTCKRKKECKIARINIGMVFIFMLCWIPFLGAICQEHAMRNDDYEDLLTVSLFAVALNYILDPVIYVSLSRDVKQQIKKLCIHSSSNNFKCGKKVSESGGTTSSSIDSSHV